MRSPRLFGVLLFALVAASVLLPSGAAHGEHGVEQGRVVGDLYVTVGLETPLSRVGEPTQAIVSVRPLNLGSGNDTGVESVEVLLRDPHNETRPLQPVLVNETFVMDVTFHEEGAWAMNVTLQPNGTQLEVTFPVYAAGPYGTEGLNANELFAVNATSEILFRFVNLDDPSESVPAPEDATARVEHWTDDHSTMLGSEIVPLSPTPEENLLMRHAFEAAGMYHVFLASPTLGVEYDDRPYIHVYASPCEQVLEWDPDHACGGGGKAAVPGVPPVGVLALLAGVGLAAHRRRRR